MVMWEGGGTFLSSNSHFYSNTRQGEIQHDVGVDNHWSDD